ncbi:Lipopolysaccharide-responsive and beige-like anchor protein, variant 2 [Clonorchis sinensis]|uniref:Lipopolysaccharide-responsive and beige-like anchor protein, variant 2 n=1 Tax=Clonorchis sinensis TaxID=79923 RepID=A0A8T1MK52_CLOSI|nr:Lipopolysaccharide-responsive and beige-like anchor protein, variant 2 [Clonorchis sinensis]
MESSPMNLELTTSLMCTDEPDSCILSSRFLAEFLSTLYDSSRSWPSHSVPTLQKLNDELRRQTSNAYFKFSGGHESSLSLSPVTKWPQKAGWSFHCWLSLEDSEPGAQSLYCFQTTEDLGFNAHFEDKHLVLTTIRTQGKGFQHRVPANLQAREWYMLTIVYVYSRWGRGEIQVYINGALQSSVELSWYIGSDHFSRCSIGGSSAATKCPSFRGRLSSVMGFSMALSQEQVESIFALGVEYQGQFQFESECIRDLSEQHRKLIYSTGNLHNSLMFAYLPSAREQNLCLNRAPKCPEVFAHSSHAVMHGNVEAVLKTTVHAAFHSLGGVEALYPLFELIDLPLSHDSDKTSSHHHNRSDEKFLNSVGPPTVGTEDSFTIVLFDLLFNLARASPSMGCQLVQTKGLLLFAAALQSASPVHLNGTLLTRFIDLARELIHRADCVRSGTLDSAPMMHSSFVFLLLRHLHGYLFCNPNVWIRAPLEVQDQLYQFLATEFLADVVRHGCVNRTTTVFQSIYTLKYYYALADPRKRSGFQLKTPDNLPLSNTDEVLKLRANLLVYIKQLVVRHGSILDTELQALLNYLLIVHEDENLHDVLYLITTLAIEQPSLMGSAFIRNDGLHVVFKLLASDDEHIRVYAIKLLGFHTQQCRLLKREDPMERYRLFTMLADQLSHSTPAMSMLTYNALIEVLLDDITTKPHLTPMSPLPKEATIKNANVLRVISTLIRRSPATPELHLIKQTFLRHLIALCGENATNRRTLLQLSLWQDCIFQFTPFYPASENEALILACVMKILRVLLFHAIRYERDGWRVWIDTLALLHLWLEKTNKQVDLVDELTSAGGTPKGLVGTAAPDAASTDAGLDLANPTARQVINQLATSGDSEVSQSSSVSNSSPPATNGSVAHDDGELKRPEQQSRTPDLPQTPNSSKPRKSVTERFLGPFRWSYLHQLLLDDLLSSIEEELGLVSSKNVPYQDGYSLNPVRSPKHGFTGDDQSPSSFAGEFIGVSLDATDSGAQLENRALTVLHDPPNNSFAINLINVLADCTDVLVSASGGLLPLLAAATSPTGEVGVFESVDNISMSDSMTFILRTAFIVDLCLLHTDLGIVEKQRNMASGSIVRQFARLYLTATVRNCLESRFLHLQPSHQLVLQLKSFTFDRDTTRFVPLTTSDAEPHSLKLAKARSESRSSTGSTEMDSTGEHSITHRFQCPQLLANILQPAFEIELESMAVRLLCLTQLVETHAFRSNSRLGFCAFPWRSINSLSAQQLHRLHELKQQHDAKIVHMPKEIQRLVYSLRPTLNYPVVLDQSFLKGVIQPLHDPQSLLQPRDLNRLQGIIFKSEEMNKVPEFLAMAIAYFVSALMVAKYRDVLEPNLDVFGAVPSGRFVSTQSSENSRHPSAQNDAAPAPSTYDVEANNSQSIPDTTTTEVDESEDDVTYSKQKKTSDNISQDTTSTHSSRGEDVLISKLNTVLTSAAIFLRDLLTDFFNHFSKQLLGSHGQTLLTTGLSSIREDQSAVGLVMLLCSQEWQTSLQKNAGLAFIELINEGRVLNAATREHLLRVSEEAVFLLCRLAMTDARYHAQFCELAARWSAHSKEEMRLCDHLISSARRRDQLSALFLNNNIHRLLNQLLSNWAFFVQLPTELAVGIRNNQSPYKRSPVTKEFYLLDCWEDDSRRRRRFSPNPYGSSHASAVLYDVHPSIQPKALPKPQLEAVLKSSLALSDILDQSTEDLEDNSHASSIPDSLSGQTETRGSELEDIFSQYEEITESMDFVVFPEELLTTDAILFSVPCVMVSFGISIRGTLSVSKSDLRFERDPSNPYNQNLDKDVLVYVESARTRWSFSEIQAVFGRRYLHRTIAIELFVTCRNSVFLAFEDADTLKRVVNVLPPVGVGSKYGLPRTRTVSLDSPRRLFQQSNMTHRWQRREVSNFDYLMYLNTISGRTYNDMNQYPIFPWILSNYTSEQLDLNEPTNYRDLSKPIGALDPKRKAYFDERYATWDDDSQPPFHYGTHYSTAAFVLGYLLRIEPFTTLFLHLQSGKFDHPDRTFFSVGRTWDNCRRNTSDVKELIPEFFYLPEMFENPNGLTLGTTEDGEDIGLVTLPPWASSPEEFVRIHRQALESELVSCQLHHWIDLIFGYKQRGAEAVAATNVFHYLTYEGSVDWSKITDPVLTKAVEDQIHGFGQTPAQLLRTPHPHRNSALHMDPLMFSQLRSDFCTVFKFYSNSPVMFISCHTDSSSLPLPSVLTVTANRTAVLTRWNSASADNAYQSARALPIRLSKPSPSSAETEVTSTSSETVGNAVDDSKIRAPSSTSATDEPTRKSSHRIEEFGAVTHGGTPLETHISYLLSNDLPSSQHTSPHGHCLGENFDLNLEVQNQQFATILDNRVLLVCGYDDCSFRLYSMETAHFIQAVYGHFDIVTCISHSECQPGDHCYLATGSRDCTVKLWIYNTRRLTVLGDRANGHASALVTIIGHETEVTSVSVSAELGLIISGSKAGTCLLHTTRGKLLRQLATLSPVSSPQPGNSENTSLSISSRPPIRLASYHREGYLLVQIGSTTLNLYTLNGKLIKSSDLNHLAAVTNYELTAVVFSTCGRYLLVAGSDGVVWVLHSHSLAPIHTFPRCDAPIRSLTATKAQRFLLVGLATGSLVVFYLDFSRWHHEFQERYSD